jgi:response regulator RpfG family c-di-GMP phosphodiesterase
MDKKRVLIVDDDTESLALIGGILKPYYEINAAKSGENALKILQNSNLTIDFMILDINMPPGMNGFEVLETMETLKINIPVIMLTGDEGGESLKKAQNCEQIILYMKKPPRSDRLLEEIEKVIRENEIRRKKYEAANEEKEKAARKETLKKLLQKAKRPPALDKIEIVGQVGIIIEILEKIVRIETLNGEKRISTEIVEERLPHHLKIGTTVIVTGHLTGNFATQIIVYEPGKHKKNFGDELKNLLEKMRRKK